MHKTKLLKVSSFYPEYLIKLYREDPLLKHATYVAQYQRMMEQGIGWADYWKINLEKTGLFDVELIIINNEYAQKKWAAEHNVTYTESNWLKDIFIEQVRHVSPDIVFANDYVFVTPEMIRQLKVTFPSIRKYIGWDGVGLCDAERFSEFDLMISCGMEFVNYYKQKGLNAVLFQFAFEPDVLNRIQTGRKLYDVTFTGSLTLRNNGHHNRLKLLGKVASELDVHYWIASFDENKLYLLKNIIKKLKSGAWGDVKDILNLWRINKGQLFGIEMYQVLANSLITLNSHIDTAVNIGGNIRLWEATGVGACLVTDWKDNMAELFVPDEEVVVYKSPEECVDKVRYLLQHPEKAKQIAEAGQKRTLTNYTYEKRLAAIAPLLLN